MLSAYWKYLDPILFCASGFPSSFGDVFSEPQFLLVRLHAEGLYKQDVGLAGS